MHILANDIQSDDGVANAAIYEAAQRLEEQNQRIKRLEEAGDLLTRMVCRHDGYGIFQDEEDAVNSWHKAKEAKP